MQRVDARFQLVDELDAAGQARQLRIELRGDFAEACRLLGAVVHLTELAENRIHRRLELRRPRAERGEAIAERFERGTVRRQLVAQLYRFGVRLVEFLDVLAQGLEILAALFEAVVLRRGPLRHILDLRQPLGQRLETRLLLRQLVGVRHQRLEFLAEHIGLLIEQ